MGAERLRARPGEPDGRLRPSTSSGHCPPAGSGLRPGRDPGASERREWPGQGVGRGDPGGAGRRRKRGRSRGPTRR